MNYIGLIVGLLLPLLAIATPLLPRSAINRLTFQTAGKANGTLHRIVGGENAANGDAPYIASLRYVGGSHWCGGTIVSTRDIVTASHCIDGDTASQIQVRINTLTHNAGGTLYLLSRMAMHPDYDSYEIDNDIAILVTATALDLSGVNAGTAALPAQGQDPPEGADVLVSGWGTLTEGSGSLPTNLQKVTVPIVGRAKCSTQYAQFGGVTEAMICAGVDEGGKDACQGDSGGPLVSGNVLWGATSWGYGCARPNYAGVYTRVGLFVNWLQQNGMEL